jgi:hypothetical protein
MTRPTKRVWYVWETEYPEEGSLRFLARSWQEAKAKYRRAWGWEPTNDGPWTVPLTACESRKVVPR